MPEATTLRVSDPKGAIRDLLVLRPFLDAITLAFSQKADEVRFEITPTENDETVRRSQSHLLFIFQRGALRPHDRCR